MTLETVNEKGRKRNPSSMTKNFDNSVLMLHPIKPIENRRSTIHAESAKLGSTIDSENRQLTAVSLRNQAELQKKWDIVDQIRTERAKAKKQKEKSEIRD